MKMNGAAMRSILFGVVVSTVAVVSCGDMKKSSAQPKKAWNRANNPFLLDSEDLRQHRYTNVFSELPMHGALDEVPWSDSYWPTVRGGLTYRWNDARSTDINRYRYALVPRENLQSFDVKIMSPMEKFDLYRSRYDYPYTKKERTRTSRPAQYWEGLCDAWAAASLEFNEPGPVTVKNQEGLRIPFGSSDVKGLLIHLMKVSRTKIHFLGTRCRADMADVRSRYNRGLISRAEYLRTMESCSGINAGAFHIVLANQIGRIKKGFIVDIDPGREVWNHPVYAYSSRILSDRRTRSADSAPGTVREVEFMTSMKYVVEKRQSWYINNYKGIVTANYHYRVEIDSQGKIIGGLWLGSKFPDFAWKQDTPQIHSRDLQAIKEIYQASMRQRRSS